LSKQGSSSSEQITALKDPQGKEKEALSQKLANSPPISARQTPDRSRPDRRRAQRSRDDTEDSVKKNQKRPALRMGQKGGTSRRSNPYSTPRTEELRRGQEKKSGYWCEKKEKGKGLLYSVSAAQQKKFQG